MSDLIRVAGLEVEAHVGVTDEEQASPQLLLVGVEVRLDLTAAAASDDLDDTVDYGSLVEAVARRVENTRARLLEHLAAEIVDQVRTLPGVAGVTVEVAKKHPPIDRALGSVSVVLQR